LRWFQIQTWKYPRPDNLITFTASGNIIWYQWTIWNNLKNNLKISWENSIKYAISQDGRYFQTLDFIENNLSSTYYLNAFARNKQIPYSTGDKLWIILKNDNTLPNISTFDVLTWSHLSQEYFIYFTNDEIKNGVGSEVLKIMEFWWNLGHGIVGYWWFDDSLWSQSTTANLTPSSQKNILFQDVNNFSITQWKRGNALFFTGASQTWLTLKLDLDYNDFSEWTTLSFLTKTIPWKYNQAGSAYVSIGNLWLHLYASASPEDTHIRFIPYDLHQSNLKTLQDGRNPFYSFLRFWITSPEIITPTYSDNQYHLHTITFNDWWKMRYYIDNNLVYKNDYEIWDFWQQFVFSWSLAWDEWVYWDEKIQEYKIIQGNPSKWSYPQFLTAYKEKTFYYPNNINIGTNGYWYIDELRIYNRMLDDNEILQLYDFLK
jgi:hypothetical protein